MKIHGTAKGGALSTKEFGVAFGGAAAAPGWDNLSELKSYWKFDNLTGNVPNMAESVGSIDSIGSGADIILNDATQGADGIIDKSVSFNGTSSYGELGTSLSQWSFFHEIDAVFTVSVWVYFSGTVGGRILDNVDSSQTNGINLNVIDSGELQLQIFADTSVIFSKGWFITTLLTGQWYNFVWTCDQSLSTNGGAVWVNGVSQGTRDQTSNNGNTDEAEYSLKTAKRGGLASGFLNARLDEFSIWNRVLTDEEIILLYNDGAAFAL